MKRPRGIAVGLVCLAVVWSMSGCVASRAADSTTSRQRVVVFAAASLTGAFKQIALETPGLDVSFTFDGSPTLVEQLDARPNVADVLATADEATMRKATDAQLVVGPPTIVALNSPVLIVPKDNPGRVTGLNQTLTGKKLVICAATVPCGVAARTIAQNAGVTLTPVSEEQKVTDVLGKVTSGEADAGIVFATDARSAREAVVTMTLPGAERAMNRYPVAVTAQAPHPDAARAFLQAVTSEKGRAVLASYGFTLP